MVRVLLVRHGETLGNAEHRFNGHTNDALSETGRAQAKKLAARLKGEKLAAVYASDLDRAYDTAAAVAAEHGLVVTKLPALREIHLGHWEGQIGEHVLANHGEAYERYRQDPLNTRIPGGESFLEVRERVGKALAEITAKHADETIVVVSHGGAICSILNQYLDGEFWACSHGNTGYSILEFSPDGVKVVSYNNLSHLEE